MEGKLGQYQVLDVVGLGPHSVCRKVLRKRDNKLLMWKEIDYGVIHESRLHRLHAREKSLKSVHHTNIIRYHDLIIDQSTAYLVTEYCPGDSLSTIIRLGRRENHYLEEETVWLILNQLLTALRECHSTTNREYLILHQNLKPTNIFLQKGKVKLADFAFPKPTAYEKENSMSELPPYYYTVPEKVSRGRYSSKSDIWSLGCLVFEICTFVHPNFGENLIDSARIGNRLPPIYSQKLKRTISAMLTIKEDDRPTAFELTQMTFLALDVKQTLQMQNKNSENATEDNHNNESEITLREEKLRHREAHLHRREKQIEKLEKKLAIRRQVLHKEFVAQVAAAQKQPSTSNYSAATLPSPSKKKKQVHFQLETGQRYSTDDKENRNDAHFYFRVSEWEKRLKTDAAGRDPQLLQIARKPEYDVTCKHLANL